MSETQSSSYQSLYRKWRPQSFGDVVAQQYPIRTLKNAIEQNEIAHAYLFAGPRGTGKTSIARIFAKAVNCRQRKGPEPCNECDSCQRITRGSELDVIEIDGASNRGIDQIRQLREEVNFAPTDCPYKIYIIDEVHMLTNEAFNALLKTLEEPPKRVIFVFATTEAHKVPSTVLSRCQAFEFRQIGTDDMAQHLAKVAEAEEFAMEPGVFTAIARYARGGMRDGLVLLEQLTSFKGQNEITTEDLYEILGLPSEVLLDEFLTALIERDYATSLKIIDDLADRGRDLDLFVRELLHRSRAKLVAELGSGGDGSPANPQQWIGLTSALLEIKREMRYAFDKRILLEVKVLELGQPKPAQPEVGLQPVQQQPATQPTQQKQPQSGQPQSPAETSKSANAHSASQKPPQKRSEPQWEPKAGPKEPQQAASTPADSGDPQPDSQPDPTPKSPPKKSEPLPPGAWNNLIESTKREKIAVHALLKEAAPRVDGAMLYVEFPPDFGFHKDRLEQKDNIGYLREKVKSVFGEYDVRVGFSSSNQGFADDDDNDGDGSGGSGHSASKEFDEEFKSKVELVREVFEGEIVQ